MEFHVSRAVRTKFDAHDLLFGYAGNAIFANLVATREFARKFNEARAASYQKPTHEAPVSRCSMEFQFAMGGQVRFGPD